MLILANTTIYTPDRRLERSSIIIENGLIRAIQPAAQMHIPGEARTIEASDYLVTPGFIDLQINGAFGEDFTLNPSSLWLVGEQLPCYGVTSFLPTIITSPLETIARAQQVIQNGPPENYQGAAALGLHIEGPFLNRDKKGAHNPAHLRQPSVDEFQSLGRSTGVRLVTLAPELPGAEAVIRALIERGVVVSAGHSLATFQEARAAFDLGVRYGTHLFNAMPPLSHFEPGLPGALLTDDRPWVGLITDGIHVHPAAVQIIWKAAGPRRLTLVTDAIAALGMPEGKYQIGDQEVFVHQGSARLESGVLAGSVLSLDQALRNLIDMTGCSIEEALGTITVNPARLLGEELHIGQLLPGMRADINLLTRDLEVALSICGGEVVYLAK
jgi:N-acetylglucosamine-6-phosphate deacetylase